MSNISSTSTTYDRDVIMMVLSEKVPFLDETIRDYIGAVLQDVTSRHDVTELVGGFLKASCSLKDEEIGDVCRLLSDELGLKSSSSSEEGTLSFSNDNVSSKRLVVPVSSISPSSSSYELKRLEDPFEIPELMMASHHRMEQQRHQHHQEMATMILKEEGGWISPSPLDRRAFTNTPLESVSSSQKSSRKHRDNTNAVSSSSSRFADSKETRNDTATDESLLHDHAIMVNAPSSTTTGHNDSGSDDRRVSRRPDIRIENFDISCHGRLLLVETNVFLVYGRKYGLVGRNGTGKSTFMKSLASRALPVPSSVTMIYVEQEVTADDTTALQSVLNANKHRNRLLEEQTKWQLILQNTSHSSSERERDEASRHLNRIFNEIQELDLDKDTAIAAKILSGLGFASEKHLWPTKAFSGGWRMRLALAGALFTQPDLLLLDEPTNMLDVKAVLWLETYLQTWPKTVLVVSHDRDFLNAISTDILHLVDYKLNPYRGNYDTFQKSRMDRLSNQKREFDSQLMYRKHLQAFIDRWRCSASRASQAQSKLKTLNKLPDLRPVEDEGGVVFIFPQPEPLAPPLLQLHDVAFGYEPSHLVLNQVNLGLDETSRVALIGANGMGKSTLLKLIIGDLNPTKGHIQRHGRLRFGYFSQHHVDQLDDRLSPLEFLQTKFPGLVVEDYRRRLGSFGISGNLALRPIRVLSGGQKSRVAFTIMCWHQPHVLVLDEPTNHLDIESIEGLIEALKTFQGAILIVSHDEHLIASVCQQIWLCEAGQVHQFDGNFGEYRKRFLSQYE